MMMKVDKATSVSSTGSRAVAGRHAQRGVTSIEYALVGALIAMVIVGTVTTLGLTLEDFYTMVSGEVAKVTPGGGG